MKNQRGSGSSSCHGLLSIKSLWNKEPQQDISIERTFSNESTIEKDHVIKRPKRQPQASPTSVAHCDIFRPLRETFFSDEKEEQLTLKRARPICCASLLDVDDDEDEDKEPPVVPLTRQDALMTTLEMLERADDETVDSRVPRVMGLGDDQAVTKHHNKRAD